MGLENLDDVTRFSPIQKNGPDRHMELGPNLQGAGGMSLGLMTLDPKLTSMWGAGLLGFPTL